MGAEELQFLTVDEEPIVSLRAVGTIGGVVVRAVGGLNGPGTGRLRSMGDGRTLAWLAPGSETWGEGVAVAGDGELVLYDGEDAAKWVRVEVWEEHLQAGPAEASVRLEDVYNNDLSGADMTNEERLTGGEWTWQILMRNAGANTLLDVEVWYEQNAGYTRIEIEGSLGGTGVIEADPILCGAMPPGETRVVTVVRWYDPEWVAEHGPDLPRPRLTAGLHANWRGSA